MLNRIRKIFIGMLLRCPNCERGRMFSGLFKMEEKCAVCGARFERREGESVGGMMINLGLAEGLTILGVIIEKASIKLPLVPELIFWMSFNILFTVFFYRHARGMWVGVIYLTGGVHPDEPEAQP